MAALVIGVRAVFIASEAVEFNLLSKLSPQVECFWCLLLLSLNHYQVKVKMHACLFSPTDFTLILVWTVVTNLTLTKIFIDFMRKYYLLLCLLFSASAYAQDYTAIKNKLEMMYETDQRYRIILDSLFTKAKLEWTDPQIQKWIPVAQRQDSINLVETRAILDQHGWLGIDQIGKKANESLFLIIQHADSSIIQRYFPLLAQSYELGQTPPRYYALMLDRLLTDLGQKQVFGTQLKKENGKFVTFPLQDEKGVEQRRKRMGLEPLAKQLKELNAE